MPGLHHESTDGGHHASQKEMPHVFAADGAGIVNLVVQGVFNCRLAFAVLGFLKKERTRVAFILAAWCFGEGVYCRERPFALDRPNVWVVLGLLLIAGGLAFRFAALGCLRKKERLATHGVYSLCRHPLYLGSVLLAYGFCALFADAENFVVATAYFVVFYPLTILWEEKRLAVRYGEAHTRYRAQTPMLLPLGTFQAGEFTWHAAMSRGGALLLGAVVMLIASVQVMAAVMLP